MTGMNNGSPIRHCKHLRLDQGSFFVEFYDKKFKPVIWKLQLALKSPFIDVYAIPQLASYQCYLKIAIGWTIYFYKMSMFCSDLQHINVIWKFQLFKQSIFIRCLCFAPIIIISITISRLQLVELFIFMRCLCSSPFIIISMLELLDVCVCP